jgi:hypothetical protein
LATAEPVRTDEMDALGHGSEHRITPAQNWTGESGFPPDRSSPPRNRQFPRRRLTRANPRCDVGADILADFQRQQARTLTAEAKLRLVK